MILHFVQYLLQLLDVILYKKLLFLMVLQIMEVRYLLLDQLMLLQELDLLQRNSEQDIATTLVAFPQALRNFEDYLQFFDEAQDLLLESGLDGVVQLASFHPQYRFAGEAPEAASHFSNRAPYPLIHLLREAMISRALEHVDDPSQIPDGNIQTLNTIGVPELERRWQALFLR